MSQASTTIEQHIQAARADVAPRITPDDIKANIVSEHYFTAADGDYKAMENAAFVNGSLNGEQVRPIPTALHLLTFCVLVLRNNFTVTGESACASPENFNADIGRRIARENAVAKIWPLMGYELRSKLAQPEPTEQDMRMAFKGMPMTLIAELVAEDAGLLGLVEGERSKLTTQQSDCPHAAPHRYCAECVADPCPIGLATKGGAA